MTETLKLIVTKFTDEAITISSLVLLFVLAVLIVYWLYNRRKFRKLTHQIPASVVKNYLDSIIQNSSSLKSSLFRGSGLDLGEGIPSVMPLRDLPVSGINVAGNDSESLNQKVAEVNSLKGKLSDKDRLISELEKRLEAGIDGDASEQIDIYKKELSSLKEKLKLKDDEIEAARSAVADGGSGADTSDLEARLAALTKERDEMRDSLAEYEIISEELANLKRLQQENEQLKKELEALRGGKAPAAKPAGPAKKEVAEEVAEEVDVADEIIEQVAAEAEPEAAAETSALDDFEQMISSAPEEEASEPDADPVDDKEMVGKQEKGEQRSAEELLSEFEKMLG